METTELGVRIRKMNEGDLPRVQAIDSQIVGPDRSISWPLRVEAHWWVYRGMPNFVAQIGSEVVGFILGDIRGGEQSGAEACGWIDMMGVIPAYRRKGIGTQLVEAFCKECKKRDVKARLVIMHNDDMMVKFWESCGFHKGDLVVYQK